jgi:hypothetical protein
MPKGAKIRTRGVYGKPWSKMVGEPIEITQKILQRLGRALVRSVVAEAKRDLALQGRSPTPKGDPEGLPTTESFLRSFGYKVAGKSTVVITSTWPWIEQIKEGREPYKMTWLTRQRGVYRVPLVQSDGTVLVRMAPLTTQDAWIHPGFARHTFLERGVKKARKRMATILAQEVMDKMAEGDPFK